MRKELVVILVLLVGGVLVAYNWAGNSPLAIFSARGVTKVEDTSSLTAPVAAAEPAKKTKQKAGRATGESAGKKTANEAAAAPPVPLLPSASVSEKTPVSACCDKPQFPFPTPETLRTGATKAEIRAAYGAPSMDIAGTREGRVLENYYYLNPEQNRLTIAHLQNGQLVSAEALSSPYFNLPRAGSAADSPP